MRVFQTSLRIIVIASGLGGDPLVNRFAKRCSKASYALLLASLLPLTFARCSQGEFGPSAVGASGVPVTKPGVADRQLVWAVPGPTGFGEPTVGEDVVFFLATDHSLRALDKATGAQRWTTSLPVQGSVFPGLASLLLPGQLIVADQDVFSVDPATGVIQWHFQAPFGRRPGYDAPVAADGVLYAGSVMGHVFAIDQRTGVLRWAQTVGDSSNVAFRPVISNGVLYVGVTRFPPGLAQIESRVVAIEASTGSIRWARNLPLLVARPATGTRRVVVIGGLVIAASGDGVVHALDAATGETRWTGARAEPPAGWGMPSPLELDSRGLATDGTRIYVSSSTGLIVALSPTDGSKLWTSPVNLGGLFELRTDGRNVYAVYAFGPFAVLDAATGAVRWSYDGTAFAAAPNEAFGGTAAFDANYVFLNGYRGFYAFRKE